MRLTGARIATADIVNGESEAHGVDHSNNSVAGHRCARRRPATLSRSPRVWYVVGWWLTAVAVTTCCCRHVAMARHAVFAAAARSPVSPAIGRATRADDAGREETVAAAIAAAAVVETDEVAAYVANKKSQANSNEEEDFDPPDGGGGGGQHGDDDNETDDDDDGADGTSYYRRTSCPDVYDSQATAINDQPVASWPPRLRQRRRRQQQQQQGHQQHTQSEQQNQQRRSAAGRSTIPNAFRYGRRRLATPGRRKASTARAARGAAHDRRRFDDLKPEIKIGFLGTFFRGRMLGKLVVGAMPLAVHDVNEDPHVLPDHRLSFVAENVGQPEGSGGVRKMTLLRNQSVRAFIGPDESCYAEALVADAWNLPMITYMCYDQRVSSGQIFRTFARTLPSSSKVSKSVISLLKYFEWTRVTLVVAETTTYVQTYEVLINLAKKHNVTVAGTYMITGDYMETNVEALHRIVKDSFRTTRIYILLTDTHALIDFVGAMEQRGLLIGGEYAIISVEEDEIYNPLVHYQFMIKEWDRPHYDSRFDATPFRSVLMITPCAPQLEAYQRFQENVQKFASQPPLCIPFHPAVQVDIPPYAAMAYDAVWLYARAATELLRNNKSLEDGTALINVIRNSVYRSVMGFDIRVDENGEAEGNYTVLGFANATDEHLSPIGRFSLASTTVEQDPSSLKSTELPIFNLETEVAWLGGGPPLSEPRCGFYKEKCISKQGNYV